MELETSLSRAAFLNLNFNSKMSQLLLLVTIPAQIIYLTVVFVLQNRLKLAAIHLTWPLAGSLLLAILVQVFIVLQLSHVELFIVTRLRLDPENSAVPLVSAFNNLIGNCVLACVFVYLRAVHDVNANLPSSIP